jgi:nitroimidazol reductase NimA-like FMN-containing flavoprotein (pyridoxamine 5'-phosphate oxidase superfamily)
MVMSVELGFEECATLLCAGVAGRVAVCTPDGPHVIPLNYSIVDGSVVLRTSPYSVLGTYGRGAKLAFEVDNFDEDHQEGWSVVARGRGEEIRDTSELNRVRAGGGGARPWADGSRPLYLRIPWTELSGRRLGHAITGPVAGIMAADHPIG